MNKPIQYPYIPIFLFLLGLFSTLNSFAQPSNDDCSNAVLLTSSTSCVNTAGTNVNATWNPSTFTAGCGAINKLDVWYRFVAQSSTQTITVSSAPSQVRLELFSGACGSLASLGCGNTSLTNTTLTVGTTYYIRVYTQNNNTGTFNICVTHSVPANDDCSGAISLTSYTSCINTAGTLNLATANGATALGCFAAGTYYDVWYSFMATTTTETVTISSLGANITNPQIQIYGGTCAALTNLTACGTTSVTKSGLTIGTTYYVRVANLNSNPSGSGNVANFNICVTHTGPANDNCTNAISLTSGLACVNTAGTLVGATYTTISSIGCGTASRNDVWYSFVAVSESTTITLSSAPANSRLQLFSGTCASLTSISCGTSSLAATGLTVGSTYYVRVYSDPDVTITAATFNICVTHLRPTNDDCAGAISLNSLTSCVNTAGTLNLATANGTTPLGCFGAGTYYDVWYSFVASATTETITLSSLGVNITNPKIQLYSGTCAALVSVACGTNSVSNAALIIGNTYYIRVANFTTDPSGTGTAASFNICVTHTGLANDQCAGATTLTSSTTCISTHGDLTGATYTATSIPGINCTGVTPNPDLWYSFIAQTPTPIIKSSNGTNRQRIELFSGSCGSFTSLGCGSGATATINATNLTVGNTYYVRVTTSNASALTFDICVQDQIPASSINYSKSYINVTKLATGGGVEPGDILEIRATFVVLGGTVDSVAFYDTLQANSGFTLLSSNLATQTNEGKIYKSFTDASGDDEGWYSVSGSDTTIQMNIGSGASSTKRGTIVFLDKPKVYSSATIIMATYRVQVYAPYDSKINWGGGAFTYKDRTTGITKTLSFANDSLVVYQSPGLCSSALSTNNQVGIETNGTFGTPATGAPLARNRGTSSAVLSYNYRIFATGTGPNDYYYGVANNTSASYSTLNTWTKPDASAPSHRVFNLWDIIGDHTGAANTAKGNAPCDTTQPVSATNPCGYMLVVNAAYKTDTAFRSSITGLCPNTYYELSAWLRNICYKCGCDSNGTGATSAGYIPFATNDSSGVPPNLAFQIDGQDYYTTGNIYYTGTGTGITPQASDSVNAWVKRGFVYKTGPTQTAFEFLIRNNGPGGGGNDWAIDDIVVATCSPEITVTPGPNPFVCDSNTVDLGATVASYYDNYVYYKWEKSTDNGATWSSTGVTGGPMTPIWNGSAWAYNVTYPTFIAYASDSGSQYRVVAASTPSNLTNSSCSFTNGAKITLTVDPCGALLDLDILSFRGKNENNKGVLYWTTSKEEEPVNYEIQKSKDGSRFTSIGETLGFKDPAAQTNNYTFTDPDLLDNTLSWFRIKEVKTQSNKSKYSKVIQLIGDKAGLQIGSLINPFSTQVKFDLISGIDGLVQVQILDQYQHTLKAANYNLVKGKNMITISNTDNLPAGFYILKIVSGTNIINRKIIKRN
jgi:hypothetical protein